MDAICATLPGVHRERLVVVRCEKNAVGRYLVIRIDALDSILTLCEVKVFLSTRKYINDAMLYFRLPRCGVTLCFALLSPVRAQQNKS